jgi:Trm5-related predicted tRNA methylase
VLCGTSRIETKHKKRAKAPAMPIVILDVMMPNVCAQAGRVESVQQATETESRPCLEHICSASGS